MTNHTLKLITGGRDELVEKLAKYLPELGSGFDNSGVYLFEKLDKLTPKTLKSLLSSIPIIHSFDCFQKDLIQYFVFHPHAVQKTDVSVFFKNPESKPTIRMGSSIYLQRTYNGLTFPSLGGFENCSNRESETFGAPPDYEFLRRELAFGDFQLELLMGIPTRNKPDLRELIQSSVEMQKIAHELATHVSSDYGGDLQNPLAIDHTSQAETRLEDMFLAWVRMEGSEGVSNDSFRLNEITDELVKAIYLSFLLTIETSGKIAKDYVRFRGSDSIQAKTLGYCGVNTPELTYSNITQPIKKYLAGKTSD